MKIILYVLAFIGLVFLSCAFGMAAIYVILSALSNLIVSFWPVILIAIIALCLVK